MSFDQEQSDKYCIFRCSGETFCLPALSVRHVVPQVEVTPIPMSTKTLVGMVKIQQELMTLFSLEQIYDFSQRSTAEHQKILVLNRDTGPWGLLIDEVETLAELEISICPQSSVNDRPNYVIGSATYKDEFVTVIDPENLYSVLTGQLHEYWAEQSHRLESEDTDQLVATSS